MSSHPKTIVVGYSAAAIQSLQDLQEPGSVFLIDEPDVIRKREIEKAIEGYSVVDRLIPYEYQSEGAADSLYALLGMTNAISVVPIVEYATPFAARLAERFGLPGAGYGAATILRNKDILRKVSQAFGVANPASRIVKSADDIEAFRATVPGTVILKPANRQGSVGTVIIRSGDDANDAFRESQERDEGVMVPDRAFEDRTLIEQFVHGSEYSVEALVSEGTIIFSNVTEKHLFPGARPIEQSHIVPAQLTDTARSALVSKTQVVLKAVGFGTGIVHCEWILEGKTAYLVECAGRFAGDGIIDLINRAYNFDIVSAFHELMKGSIPNDLPKTSSRTAIVHFLGGETGKISAIRRNEELSEMHAADVHISAVIGDVVGPPKSSWDRLGSITLDEPTYVQASSAIEQIASNIVFDYEKTSSNV